MKRIIGLIVLLLFLGCSKHTITKNQTTSTEIAFVLCEGNLGGNNSSIHTLNSDALNLTTGDTGQSIAVYGDNILVINNGSSNVVIYNISVEGIIEYSSVIDLNGSQPREILIIDDKAYISQWNVNGIAVIDLQSFTHTATIEVEGASEGLAFDGTYIYTAIIYSDKSNWLAGDTVVKINPTTKTAIHIYNVFTSPVQLIIHNDMLYVSHTYYDADYNKSFASSRIDLMNDEVIYVDHGNTNNFENDFSINNGILYRAYNKGIVSLNEDLYVDISTYIGTEYSGLYSMKINTGFIYLGFGDGIAPDNIIILDFDGKEVDNFEVGASPGSFAFWESE